MNQISAGVITFVNGVITLAHGAMKPWVGLSGLIAISLVWMALLEIEHMDRVSSAKPDVERH